jgi:hypothetical protein
MFLRGTGTSSLSETNAVKEGPTLMSTQQDSNKEHSHNKGTLVTGIEGDHNHHKTVDEGKTSEKIYDRITRVGTGDNVAATSRGPYAGLLDLINSQVMPDAGDHTHPILGSVASSGLSESRPVNYGVNYIIKL